MGPIMAIVAATLPRGGSELDNHRRDRLSGSDSYDTEMYPSLLFLRFHVLEYLIE